MNEATEHVMEALKNKGLEPKQIKSYEGEVKTVESENLVSFMLNDKMVFTKCYDYDMDPDLMMVDLINLHDMRDDNGKQCEMLFVVQGVVPDEISRWKDVLPSYMCSRVKILSLQHFMDVPETGE